MTNDMKNMEVMNDTELNEVTGGGKITGYRESSSHHHHHHHSSSKTKTVSGLTSGWLALRSEPCYNTNNEIGHLFNGDKVEVTDKKHVTQGDFNHDGATTYVYVHAVKLNRDGWVNERFLK